MRLRMSAPVVLLACAVIMLATASAYAVPGYLTSFEGAYPAAAGSRIDACQLCHVNANPYSGSARNAYGSAYSGNGYNFKTIEPLDSDGDGYTNLAEITALTFPGNAADHPVAATGSLTVTILPAGAVTAGARWRVGPAGAYQNSGATVTGLAVGSVTVQFSTVTGWTTPADQSVSITAGGTTPAGGTYVQLASVPNVVGQMQAAASTLILGAGLVVGTIAQEYSQTVPEGTVINQTPSAGEFVAPGSAVLLTVSKGVQPIVTGSIVINKGAWATNTVNVTLTLTWSSNAVRMRFSDNGANWTMWEPLKATRTYTLPAGDGYKTVRVQFLDIANNRSVAYNDYIILDTVPPTGSIAINNGAQATSSASVTLSLTASDAGSGVQSMRFSDNGSTWSLWEPVAATRAYVLPGPAGGYNTVRVQYRDAAGNYSAIYSDYIFVQGI